MKTLSRIAQLAVLSSFLPFFTTPARAIISTFDTDLDGWTGGASGTLVWQSTGGNPGGYVQVLRFITADMYMNAPSKFRGNLSAYDGQTISFDAGNAPAQSGTALSSFGLISLYYNNLPTPLTQDIAPGIPGTAWQTYSGSFSASGFGVSQATWSTALANVTALTIDVSTYSPVSADSPVGIDNIQITPEPATLTLLACPVLLLRRRRLA